MVWTDQRVGFPYDKPGVVQSLFRRATFGQAAATDATKYAQQAFDHPPAWGSEGTFCSQFVLASYQAAAQSTGKALTGALHVDARAASVRTLEHFLKTDPEQFALQGHIRIRPADVLYAD